MRIELCSVLLFASTLFAQHEPPDPLGHSRHGAAFDEGPRQAAYRMAGMSPQVHLPVAGLSAEAQAFFDQGVCQQHGFWYFEAERSFRQVARLHPDCAMAYWGMTLANIENGERAASFIATAVEKSKDAPRYEQLWIDAWARHYGIDDAVRAELRSGDGAKVEAARKALAAKNKDRDKDDKATKEKRQRQLLKDLGTLVFEFPDDIEAKAFLALQNWLANDWGGGIPITSHAAVDALLDQVFAKAPLHPAHHYRVHLWDREAAERALRSAALIGDSAPGIAHQWHMAGHIYARLHRHREAAWQQEASSRVDHAHMQRDRVMPFEIHNYGHNQEWLVRSLSHQGRVSEALELAKNLAELPRHPKKNRIGEGDEIAGYARARLADLCEDHELWQQAVELCRSGHLDPGDDVRGEITRLGLLGRALYRLSRIAEADQVLDEVVALLPRARAARAKAIDAAEDQAFTEKADRKKLDAATDEAKRRGTDLVQSARDLERELRAEQLLARGDAAAAVAELAQVKGLPKTLLADAHVAAGAPDKAIELLEGELKNNPHRLPTLARLLLALRAADKPEHASRRAEIEQELAAMPVDQSPLAQRAGIGANPAARDAAFPADFGARPPLGTLGPLRWSPMPAPGFDLAAVAGGRTTLAAQRGKPTLVVFYLGFGCLHCVQQLQALAPRAKDFAAAGIQIVAIGNDAIDKAKQSAEALGDEQLPFPLLADPELRAFRAWRCHDDFEDLPLHGTFLVDGDGLVRWQDISFEPFLELDWLLQESRRLLSLPRAAGAGAGSK